VAEVRLSHLTVEYQFTLVGATDDMTFQIALAYPRGGDTVSLRAMSVRDCQLWMQMIDDASKRCREAEKKAARRVA
jgi:hypothetical protein